MSLGRRATGQAVKQRPERSLPLYPPINWLVTVWASTVPTLPTFVPTTMPSLPNKLWQEILVYPISLESSLAMVKPSVEHLHPFSPGRFSGFSDDHFYPSQLAKWKCSRTQARNFVQVNRLWWRIAERFLYSTFYVEEEWRVQRFIDTVELNSNLALC